MYTNPRKYWRYGSWRACTIDERFSCTHIDDGEIVHICPSCYRLLTPTDDIATFSDGDSIRTYVCHTCKVAYEGLPNVEKEKAPVSMTETPMLYRKDAYRTTTSQEEIHRDTSTTKGQSVVYHDSPADVRSNIPEKLRYLLG